jgi:DNA-directed RNA polymerase specialized sigma subunit
MLILPARRGAHNPAPLSADQQALAEQWQHLPKRVVADEVRRGRGIAWLLRFLDFEDLVMVGQLALCRAARAHRPERGLAFSTLAVLCIRNALVREIRWYRRRLHREHPAELDGNRLRGGAWIPPDDSLRVLVTRLPQRQALAVELYYGLAGAPLSQGEIARGLGVTRQAVSLMLKAALAELRITLERMVG